MFVWDFDPKLIEIGSFQVRWYGVLFASMLMIAFNVWRWQTLRSGRTEAAAEQFLTLGVIAVIGGSRLGHVLFYAPEHYLKNPLDILKVWEGGLASHGATIALLFALWYWGRKHTMTFVEVLDRFSFSACIGVIFVRVGNFTNSEIVGRITDPDHAPFAIKFVRNSFDRELFKADPVGFTQIPWRHPAQHYEAVIGLVVLGVLWQVDRKFGEGRRRGLLASIFLLGYFGGRCVSEAFKEFEGFGTAALGFTTGQALSLPFALAGLVGLALTLGRRAPETPDSRG